MFDAKVSQWSKLLQEAVNKPGLLLSAYSAFHNYSVGNQVLAITQCGQREIELGPMSTFPGWKAKGRHVRKGEKAIWLCMPLKFKDREDPDAVRIGFAYKPRWFVLSQTEGDPVEPEKAPEWRRELALSTLGITLAPFELLDGNTQGYAKGRSIAISPLAVLPHKTTFHELGHVVLGHTAEADFSDATDLPRDLREVEAECVALICCESLGLSGAEYSRGYIQKWMRGSREEIPEKSAQRIFSAADSILKAGSPRAEAETDN